MVCIHSLENYLFLDQKNKNKFNVYNINRTARVE